MNYAKIISCDFANGEGVRTSLFVSGCTHHCPGCFNPEQQDFGYGSLFSPHTLHFLRCTLSGSVVSGLSILGGDPLCQSPQDMEFLCKLCDYTHSLGKNVWLWTGSIWEDVFVGRDYDGIDTGEARKGCQRTLLRNCDVVVDGPFVEALADRTLLWRGSSNQRVIDVKKTLKQGQVVLYER